MADAPSLSLSQCLLFNLTAMMRHSVIPHIPPKSCLSSIVLPNACTIYGLSYISQLNGGPLRLRPRPSLYFLMGCILASSQTRNQMPTSSSPAACNLLTLWRSGSGMIWWCRCSTLGERERAKPLG